MPELPEVEIVRQQLEKKMVRAKVERVWFDRERMLRPTPGEFITEVREQTVTGVWRRGKFLFFSLENGRTIEAHLRMSGRLFWVDGGYRGERDNRINQYVHVRLILRDGELVFSDPRTFGYLRPITLQQLQKRLQSLGAEPLVDLTEERLLKILQSTGRKVKEVLLDQGLIAGIGNIYANDALWLAKIHPATPANKISAENSTTLHRAVENVLKEALGKGGSSQQWYRRPDGSKGEYQRFFKVYGRRGEPCLRHPEERIGYFKLGGRGSFVCAKCQRIGSNCDRGGI